MSNQSVFEEDNTPITVFGRFDITVEGNNGSNFDDSFPVKVTLSLTLITLMIISIVGNLCTCAVIIRDRTMRTPTNCYLFNLAVSDLLLALFIPIEVYFFWVPDMYPFGELGCRIHFLLWEFLSNCSVLTICAFTIERYLVVAKPFLRQKLSKKSRVYKIIGLNLMLSVLFGVPFLFYLDLFEWKRNVYCYFKVTDLVSVLIAVDVVLFFVIPMAIITVLYVMITLKLYGTHGKLRSSPAYGKQNRDKAVKMLAAVAALFFICWAPYGAYRVLIFTYKLDALNNNICRIIYYLCAINVYMSTSANPIVYSLMSHKFRTAFKELLKGPTTKTRTGNDTQSSLVSTVNSYKMTLLTQVNNVPTT